MYLKQIVSRSLVCVISTIVLLLIILTPLEGYSLVIDSFTAGTPDLITDSDQSWPSNSLSGYSVKIVSGTCDGDESVIYRNTATSLSVKLGCSPNNEDLYEIYNTGMADGNSLVSSNSVQGVEPTWPSQPAPPAWDDSAGTYTAEAITSQYAPITSWNPTSSPQTEGAFCIRCHSAYSYGINPRNTTSGSPTSTSATWSDEIGPAVPEGDAANEFNPNNLGYHPVFSPGMNQPVADSNPNWPVLTGGDLSINSGGLATISNGPSLPITVIPGWKLSTPDGWRKVTSIISNTEFTVYPAFPPIISTTEWKLTAGLGNNFVPPWGPWSTMRCTDCHVTSSLTNDMTPHFDSFSKYHLKQSRVRKFLYWDGTSILTITLTPAEAHNLCVNCHRLDVYGDLGVIGYMQNYGSLSKHEHGDMVWGTQTYATLPKWGIVCMNCHGGERIGSIHGSNLGYGGGGNAGFSFSGERLLSGAALYSVTRGTSVLNALIWYNRYTDDAVDNINQNITGATTGSPDNYDYISDTDFFPVSAPTQITVPGSSSTGSFQVSWTASPTQDATYVLEQSSDGGNNWSAVSTYTDDTLTYTDITGLVDGIYQYRVKAVKSGFVDSSWTVSDPVTVAESAAPPGTLTVPASSTTGTIRPWWAASATPGVTYVLERSDDGGSFAEVYRGFQTYYIDTLVSGSYLYRVKAIKDGYTDSSWQTSSTCTVDLGVGYPNSISVPANTSTGDITVSWSASATPDVIYELEVSFNSGPYFPIYTGPDLSQNVILSQDGSYTFRVRATKEGYLSSHWNISNPCIVTLTPVAAPPSYITVPSNDKNGKARIVWGSSPTLGTNYELQSDNGAGYTTIYGGKKLHHLENGLAAGSYTFRVRALRTGYIPSDWVLGGPCVVQ